MRANDILPQQTLDEVSMTPSDYATDIKRGGELGVRVGFEFEICIPQTFRRERLESGSGPEQIAKLFKLHNMEIFDSSWSASDVKRFDDTFRPKTEVAKYPNMRDAILQYQRSIVPKIKRIWENDIPPETRVKIMKRIKTSGLDYKKYAEKRYSEPRVEGLIPELQFTAAAMLSAWYGNVRPGRDSWYYQIQNMLDDTWNGHIQLKHLVGADSLRVGNNFNKYFEYDPKQAMEYLEYYGYDHLDDDDDDYDVEYRQAADRLAKLLTQQFGMPTTVFNEYHERNKQPGRWYIEPDGSLDANDDDSTAEVVTPPYSAPEAVNVLRGFFDLAKQYEFYTSKENGTGLHINISIPKHVDVLKLALFVGDLHVLRQWGREASDYAQSVLRDLTAGNNKMLTKDLNTTPDIQDKISVIKSVAERISNEHVASVSDNGKYISFRHVGGNYLQDYQSVYDVLGRFVRAMIIANDPKAYREEYLKKISTLLDANQPSETKTPQKYRELIQQLQSEGLPAIECRAYLWNARVRANTGAISALLQNYNKPLPLQNIGRFLSIDASDTTKNMILSTLQKHEPRLYRSMGEKIQKAGQNAFYVGTWAPRDSAEILRVMEWKPKDTIVSISAGGWTSDGYALGKKVVLPPTSPMTLSAIKQLYTEIKQYLQKQRGQQSPSRSSGRRSRR